MFTVIIILLIAVAFAILSAVSVGRYQYRKAQIQATIAYLFMPFALLIAVLFQ